MADPISGNRPSPPPSNLSASVASQATPVRKGAIDSIFSALRGAWNSVKQFSAKFDPFAKQSVGRQDTTQLQAARIQAGPRVIEVDHIVTPNDALGDGEELISPTVMEEIRRNSDARSGAAQESHRRISDQNFELIAKEADLVARKAENAQFPTGRARASFDGLVAGARDPADSNNVSEHGRAQRSNAPPPPTPPRPASFAWDKPQSGEPRVLDKPMSLSERQAFEAENAVLVAAGKPEKPIPQWRAPASQEIPLELEAPSKKQDPNRGNIQSWSAGEAAIEGKMKEERRHYNQNATAHLVGKPNQPSSPVVAPSAPLTPPPLLSQLHGQNHLQSHAQAPVAQSKSELPVQNINSGQKQLASLKEFQGHMSSHTRETLRSGHHATFLRSTNPATKIAAEIMQQSAVKEGIRQILEPVTQLLDSAPPKPTGVGGSQGDLQARQDAWQQELSNKAMTMLMGRLKDPALVPAPMRNLLAAGDAAIAEAFAGSEHPPGLQDQYHRTSMVNTLFLRGINFTLMELRASHNNSEAFTNLSVRLQNLCNVLGATPAEVSKSPAAIKGRQELSQLLGDHAAYKTAVLDFARGAVELGKVDMEKMAASSAKPQADLFGANKSQEGAAKPAPPAYPRSEAAQRERGIQ